MSIPGYLNSTFLEPWGGQLVPCKSRYECTFVNGTQEVGLVFNVVCSTLAEVETLPSYNGYCVCPPYQLRGGPTCSDETSLSIPVVTVAITSNLIVDFVLIVTLCKLYRMPLKASCRSRRKPKRCSQLFAAKLVLASSAILYIVGHCLQLALGIGELTINTRFVLRHVQVLFVFPLPLLLTVGAALLLAVRFHLVLSKVWLGTNATITMSIGFVAVVLFVVASSVVLIGMSLISGTLSYFVLVVLLLILVSSAYFAITIRCTVSGMRAKSGFSTTKLPSHTHTTTRKLMPQLSNSVKRYMITNAFGTMFLVAACYLSVLPQEIKVDVTKPFYWVLTPYGLGVRITTYSIANFLYELEYNSANNHTDMHNNIKSAARKNRKHISLPEMYHVEHMYEKGRTEELEEQVVTVC